MAFAAAARHMNLTKASEELRISQPSMSRHLRILEEECQVKLYCSVGSGGELTEAGREFLCDVQGILSQLEVIAGQSSGVTEFRGQVLHHTRRAF